MIYIYPYKLASESARKLREGLSSILPYRVKLVKPSGRFDPRRRDLVINWGASIAPRWVWHEGNDINKPLAIAIASNKVASFNAFKAANISTPDWTTDINEAKQWKGAILCRTILNGHSGKGIIYCNTNAELVKAPLYVKYKKKK